MNKWKIPFFVLLSITVVNFALLIPPIVTDIDPDNYYRSLVQYYTASADPDEINYMLDTDSDGLTDYDEENKYRTDPNQKDSDGDGIADGNWDERREYTRTYRAVVDLRMPYSLSDMNDFYQDARLVEVLSDDISRFEVVLYPEAKEILKPFKYIPVNSSYTAETYSKNYSEDMRNSIRSKTSGVKTDLQALIKIQNQFSTIQYKKIDEDFGYSTDLPLQFQVYRNADEKISQYITGYPTTYTIDELMDRFYYADSMYKLKVRGACSSSATLRGAMFRAAGLEEQTVFTIPLFYSSEKDQTIVDVISLPERNKLNYSDERLPISDHFFNIVKIGSRWIRVDTGMIDTGTYAPYVKLLNCHDQSDYQWDSWNYETYREKRPYRYILIEEKLADHISK